MSSFEVSRSTSIAAPPEKIHGLINDLREWRKWSPWEDIDPNLERTYSGADAGAGARYAWKGNRKAGQGEMEITGSTPQRVDVALSFVKPFRAENDVVFAITPADDRSEVTWTMTGEQKGLATLFGKIVSMDRMVGKDFEKGLARLKMAAEG
jgi:hypothetical protein